jgi:hypothetical protein
MVPVMTVTSYVLSVTWRFFLRIVSRIRIHKFFCLFGSGFVVICADPTLIQISPSTSIKILYLLFLITDVEELCLQYINNFPYKNVTDSEHFTKLTRYGTYTGIHWGVSEITLLYIVVLAVDTSLDKEG